MNVTTEEFDIESASQIDLAQHLKTLSRALTKLEDEKRFLNFAEVASYVRSAEIDLEILEFQSKRTDIGKRLLAMDREREALKRQRAIDAAHERDALIQPHLGRLADFVKKVKSFEKLVEEFDALIVEAKQIQALNNRASQQGLSAPIGAFTPHAHTERLRKHMIATFGISTLAGIHRINDAGACNFDIVKDVEAAIKAALAT